MSLPALAACIDLGFLCIFPCIFALSRTLRKHTGRLLQSYEERIAQPHHCIPCLQHSHTTQHPCPANPLPQSTAPYPEPTFDETVKAICLLKNKSPGVCNTLPEMLKEGGEDVHLALHRLFPGIWRTEAAPKHFKQDILKPDARKGDSSLCATYRTIALQSIAAKADTNVIRARLSKSLGNQLLEQQHSFRPDRSCADALFSPRRACESAWNKGTTLYMWT